MTVSLSRLPKYSKLVDDSEDDSMSRLPKCSKLVDDDEGDTISRLPKCSKLESVLVVTIPDHVSVVKELSKSVDDRSVLYCGAQGFPFHKMLESVAS